MSYEYCEDSIDGRSLNAHLQKRYLSEKHVSKPLIGLLMSVLRHCQIEVCLISRGMLYTARFKMAQSTASALLVERKDEW